MKLEQGDEVILHTHVTLAVASKEYESTYSRFAKWAYGTKIAYYAETGKGYFQEYRTLTNPGGDEVAAIVLTEGGQVQAYPCYLIRKATTKSENHALSAKT